MARGRPWSPLDPPPGAAGASWVELHEMEAPGGAFLLLDEDGTPVACGGLRTLDAGAALGEVKRMYVVPAARRRGHARRLLAALEDAARAVGLFAAARHERRPARGGALYRACGYVEIADYNGSPTATPLVREVPDRQLA